MESDGGPSDVVTMASDIEDLRQQIRDDLQNKSINDIYRYHYQNTQEDNDMIYDYEHDDYYSVARRKEVREESRKLRKKFLRYKEAEIVYSIQHKKLLELAEAAGALYRLDGYVLINRDIFDEYLEQFHQAPKKNKTAGSKGGDGKK